MFYDTWPKEKKHCTRILLFVKPLVLLFFDCFWLVFVFWYFADHWEKTTILKRKIQSLKESTFWEDLDDMVIFNQINEIGLD
jgi:hypothetical protein